MQIAYKEMEEKHGDSFDDFQRQHATKILNVYVRECFTKEERVQIFAELNGSHSAEEKRRTFIAECTSLLGFSVFAE